MAAGCCRMYHSSRIGRHGTAGKASTAFATASTDTTETGIGTDRDPAGTDTARQSVDRSDDHLGLLATGDLACHAAGLGTPPLRPAIVGHEASKDLATLRLLGLALAASPQAAPCVDVPQSSQHVIDAPLLVALASRHLITPALAPRLARTLGTPPESELQRYLEAMRALNRARNRRIRLQLLDLVQVLNEADIEPVLLKGAAHLQLGLYDDDADRVIGDIDILVPPERDRAALAPLYQTGYASRPGAVDHTHLHHHPPVAHKGSEAWVELHRALSPHHTARRTGDVIRRASRMRVGGGWAGVLCAEDLVMHNIVHSQLHDRGFWAATFSLRDAYDLVRLTQHFCVQLDWSQLAARVAADVGKGCPGFYVRRAHLLLGCRPPPLPRPFGARVADGRWQLHSRGWMLWLQKASRMLAHERDLVVALCRPSTRHRPARRLLDPDWYKRHLRRLRDAADG